MNKLNVTKSERQDLYISFLMRIILAVAIWIFFRDVVDAPTWAAWIGAMICYYEWTNTDWVRLLLSRVAS